MALQNIRRKGAVAAAVIGVGALVVGCSAREASLYGAQPGASVAGAPVAVTCEPNQRAVIRQLATSGGLQSQVQCESVLPFASRAVGDGTPVAYQPGFQPVSYTQPVAMEPTRIVRASYPATRQVAAPQRVAYQRAPARLIVRQPKRSVKKSAIIIGSSAGVGAGIGAAVGGKKGAGIGALLGGGGAALWDQLTRRQQ
jgi:hypothetical protein